MANMQMAIGLGWEPGRDLVVFAGFKIIDNDIAYKVAYRWSLVFIQFTSL